MENTYFIIDFDSTFVKAEALDELARIALISEKDKDDRVKKIEEITKQGMEGKISFPQSLENRLKLFSPNAENLDNLVKHLKKSVTESVKRNREFFRKFSGNIYIISGGFREYILPVVVPFGIREDHILANRFLKNKNGKITGFDPSCFLSEDHGKIKQVRALRLPGQIIVIGDGFTDYQIKKEGGADKFFLFTENIRRENLVSLADEVLPNFDELLYKFNLPRALSYPKNRLKVLLCENISPKAEQVFRGEGFIVQSMLHSPKNEELKKIISDVSVLGIRSATNITSDVLAKAKKLLCIGAYCIGTNQLDLKACNHFGTAVFNAPFSNTRSVVELVLSNIIALSRKTFDKSNKMHQGIWDKKAAGAREIRGKKLGIVGYGNIGSQLSILAENLGMEVYFYDTKEKLVMGNAHKCDSLKSLLKISDFVTIHVDGNPANKYLIAEKEFSQMKDGVIFINTSRGFVVDLKSLAGFIRSGKVKGAAIDVFEDEPKENGLGFSSPLLGLPNVILTSHIGGSTEEAQKNIGQFVTDRIKSFINSGDTTLSVNFPCLQLPPLVSAHRFIHIHKNIPGVLAQINNILAQNKINILGQYLGTNQEIGYVISDVNKKYSSDVVSQLKNIEATLRFRVLY